MLLHIRDIHSHKAHVESKRVFPLTVFRNSDKLHICLQVPEECHSESMLQRDESLKPEK